MTPRDRRSRRRWPVLVAVVVLTTAACVSDGSDDSAAPGQPAPAGASVVRVPDDVATIGAALDLVEEGGLVLVGPGTYPEEVTIDKPDVTLRGTDRNRTVIDGGGTRSFGVFASADGVRIENLTVHSALLYGVLVTGTHDENGPLANGAPGYEEVDPSDFPPLKRFSVDHVTAYNNGLYGIYAFNARHGTIANSYASGSADSGFYVGQCEECDVLVKGNVAERNAVGFENANASDSVLIAANRFAGNRVGMTLNSDYQEAFTPQRRNVVVGNVIGPNATADSPTHALGGFGVGLGVTGGQRNEVTHNLVTGNPLTGVLLSNAEDIPAMGNRFAANRFGDNGLDVADVAADRAASVGNCFERNNARTAVPPLLLRTACPARATPVDGASSADLPRVEPPGGMSFLDVPPPPAQPGMIHVDDEPDPLPDTVAMPSPTRFPVPEATLLADRAGTT